MNASLLILTWLAPLLAALFGLRYAGRWLLPLASLPALLTALLVPTGTQLELPWLLLGIRIGVDDTGRIFLLASALVWIVAAVYAAENLRRSADAARFRVFFLLAMTGNFALILAQDIVTFYLGFTLMGLSAYGLVAHQRSASSRYAGRLYLSWTILGEVTLFCALVLIAARSGGLDFEGLRTTPPSHLAVVLLVIGFGIKLALPGLHVWLPLAYSAAPSAGAAVLSGPMISAGLLGWMRFLPPGSEALSGWGETLVAIGLVQVVFGTTVGLVQRDPKVVLGYSSIAKMGILTVGFGVALAAPQSSSALVVVLTLYATHHLLIKAALFLGIGFLERGVARAYTLATLVFLSLALAGAPLTSGAIIKTLFSNTLPPEWSSLYWLLTASAVGSTLLMGRFLYLASRINPRDSTSAVLAWTVWLLLVLSIISAPFILGELQASTRGWGTVLLGVLAVATVWTFRPQRLAYAIGRIPAGDVLYLARWRVFNRLKGYFSKSLAEEGLPLWFLRPRVLGRMFTIARRWQSFSELSIHWPLVGTLWLAMVSLIYLSLAYL